MSKEIPHSQKFFQGSVFLLEYTDVCNLLLTVIMITSLERNSLEKRKSQGNRLRCWEQGQNNSTFNTCNLFVLPEQNNFNYEAQTAVSSIKNLTFLESEWLSPKPNTMCCICIKTASATVYAYRFHSCIRPPKSQFLAAKNVCYHYLAKHLKTEIYP